MGTKQRFCIAVSIVLMVHIFFSFLLASTHSAVFIHPLMTPSTLYEYFTRKMYALTPLYIQAEGEDICDKNDRVGFVGIIYGCGQEAA